jgi:DNA-binding NarL/FixJ family response regulator
MTTMQIDNTALRETGNPVGQTRIVATGNGQGRRPGSDDGSDPTRLADHATTVLIERRALIRDCLRKCFDESRSGEVVQAFASASDWLAARQIATDPPLILLGTAASDEVLVDHEIALLSQAEPRAAIVFVGDAVDRERVLGALDKGARGYISTSTPFEVAVKAIHLVRAGGTFVPAECLEASQPSGNAPPSAQHLESRCRFTSRQLAVIELLRHGKANKVIAFELKLRESTVKVHVRNIMKKLQAQNRTEVAVRVNAMASLDKALGGTERMKFTKSLP